MAPPPPLTVPASITAFASALAQGLFLLLVAPLLQSAIAIGKAWLQGRRGPSPWLPYFHFWKWLVKQPVVSPHASPLFRAVPYAAFSLSALSLALVPAFGPYAPLASAGDLLTLFLLWGAARALIALSAMDTGSPFTGRAMSRAMTISALAEPVLFLAFFSIALSAGSTATPVLASPLGAGGPATLDAARILALAAVFAVLLAETGRLPFDDSSAHDELAGTREGLLLEHSGRHLALLRASQWAHQIAIYALTGIVFFPWTAPEAVFGRQVALPGAPLFLARTLALAGAVALAETFLDRVRLVTARNLLGIALLVGLLSLFLASRP